MTLSEEQARERIEEERGFYIHLASFAVIMPLLIALNLFTSTAHFWFVYPLLGWLMGLGGHAASVFGSPVAGGSWEQRRLASLMGDQSDEASVERLRALVDDELNVRALPEATAKLDVQRLQQRIEHLEAIVTSQDWEELEARQEDLMVDGESEEERAARLARKVR